jgi:hypothetical protein
MGKVYKVGQGPQLLLVLVLVLVLERRELEDENENEHKALPWEAMAAPTSLIKEH